MINRFKDLLMNQARQPLSTEPDVEPWGSDYGDGICDGQIFFARELCDLAQIDWRKDEGSGATKNCF